MHRKLRTGDALIDEEYYQERDTGNWLLKYHLTKTGQETWAINEFDKVYTTAMFSNRLLSVYYAVFAVGLSK